MVFDIHVGFYNSSTYNVHVRVHVVGAVYWPNFVKIKIEKILHLKISPDTYTCSYVV